MFLIEKASRDVPSEVQSYLNKFPDIPWMNKILRLRARSAEGTGRVESLPEGCLPRRGARKARAARKGRTKPQ